MFKKLLSKLGVGHASVNLVLNSPQGRVGEELSGTIFIEGGTNETKVTSISVELQYECKLGEEYINHVFAHVPVANSLVITEGQHLQFPFRFVIPEVPPTAKNIQYRFKTNLDVPGSIDKSDFDDLVILPRYEQDVLQLAIYQQLGLQEMPESGYFDGKYQEFEYRPLAGSPFFGRIDELELIIFPTPDRGLQVHVEIEKRGKRYAMTYIPNQMLTTPDLAARAFADFLEYELQNPNPQQYPTVPDGFTHRRNGQFNRQQDGYENRGGYENQGGYDNRGGYENQGGYENRGGYDNNGGYDNRGGYNNGGFGGYAFGDLRNRDHHDNDHHHHDDHHNDHHDDHRRYDNHNRRYDDHHDED